VQKLTNNKATDKWHLSKSFTYQNSSAAFFVSHFFLFTFCLIYFSLSFIQHLFLLIFVFSFSLCFFPKFLFLYQHFFISIPIPSFLRRFLSFIFPLLTSAPFFHTISFSLACLPPFYQGPEERHTQAECLQTVNKSMSKPQHTNGWKLVVIMNNEQLYPLKTRIRAEILMVPRSQPVSISYPLICIAVYVTDNTLHFNILQPDGAAGTGAMAQKSEPPKQKGAHPASYPMGTRGSFPGGKAAGA
jgi:hypothetical protein